MIGEIRNERKRQQATINIKKEKNLSSLDPLTEDDLCEIEMNIKKLQEILSKRVFQLANAYMNESVFDPILDK
jgi:hypothetical protein